MTIDYAARIPNNVDLANDMRLQRALESWQPRFLDWWRQLGPSAFQDSDVYLRTAVDIGQEGWAHFDFVKAPRMRGLFSSPLRRSSSASASSRPSRPKWRCSR